MLPVIKVTNLSKHFKDIVAVDNLSFTVNPGDVYGFLGQNGAGKSTTIRMLLSLVKPTEGRIEIFEMDLFTHQKEILRQAGAVIEKPDVYKYLTALENIQLFSKISGGAKLTRSQLLDQLAVVGLQDRASSKVKTFSQGMKQRLGIAIALVHDPKLIILDEPTNGLDPQGIADVRNLILRLSKELGKTVVVSSHLLSEIQLIANRLLIINKGKKLVEGNASELFDPAETLVELETLDNEKAIQQLQQSPWSSHLQPARQNTIVLKMDKADIPTFHLELVQMQIPVLSFQPRHSLEDYFLQLTTSNEHVAAIAN
ncbi:ABC transporter ATP-binding protein [Segetibacter aerophilus]|uniref:ABC transporter ATP-binding protein n=1 Tax=Segetibacter aerophilus TaxID=670293 RepID=A0A512BEJ2_9BACT|nr:ABC transporter ATP-binding protein [Segetibacter aerophilus]GEO10364.1 ABC transporter ATP-binding protein [Segetibacter aerophilus]